MSNFEKNQDDRTHTSIGPLKQNLQNKPLPLFGLCPFDTFLFGLLPLLFTGEVECNDLNKRIGFLKKGEGQVRVLLNTPNSSLSCDRVIVVLIGVGP